MHDARGTIGMERKHARNLVGMELRIPDMREDGRSFGCKLSVTPARGRVRVIDFARVSERASEQN